MPHSVRVSAPGSLMLLGEYAVLQNHAALVCALDKRMTVTVSRRTDDHICIHSNLGNHDTTLSQLEIVPPFEFILAAIVRVKHKLFYGLNIHVDAGFSDQVGFGSSAAVTVATVFGLAALLELSMDSLSVLRDARDVVRLVQGRGSGADVAASVFGGIVYYRQEPLVARNYSLVYPLAVYYAGFKTKTKDAIRHVEERFRSSLSSYHAICDAIGECSEQAVLHIEHQNVSGLGQVMLEQQALMQELGVNLPVLQTIVDAMCHDPRILGAKISGSGLGDCVIGLGECDLLDHGLESYPDVKRLSVAMTLQGVQYE